MRPDTAAAIQLLQDWGIDPYECYADGFGPTGYLVRSTDSFGRTEYTEDGGMALLAKDWPKGFPVERFLHHVGHSGVGRVRQ